MRFNLLISAALGCFFLVGNAQAYNCVQEAQNLGRGIGSDYCGATKNAFSVGAVIFPGGVRRGYSLATCSDGTPFDWQDRLACKNAMAQAVQYDHLCRRILYRNASLPYDGATKQNARQVYEEFQVGCN